MSSYKVRLSGPGGTIWLEASPTLSESRQGNYQGYDIVHLPSDIFAYRNTSGRKFSVGGKLVSRNVKEANSNAGYLNLARKWMLPGFGSGPGIAGATPPILRLYAYNNKNINGVYVILRSYSFDFPEDVDYIYQGSEPMPVIGSLRMEVDEAYSAAQITAGEWKIKGGSNGRATDNGGSGSSSSSGGASGSGSNSSGGSSGGLSFNRSGSSNSISAGSVLQNSSNSLFTNESKFLNAAESVLSSFGSNIINETTSQIGNLINNNPLISNILPQNGISNIIPNLTDLQSGTNFNLTVDTNVISDSFKRISDKIPFDFSNIG